MVSRILQDSSVNTIIAGGYGLLFRQPVHRIDAATFFFRSLRNLRVF